MAAMAALWSSAGGERAFTDLFGRGVEVLTVSEVCRGSPWWRHSPDERSNVLLLAAQQPDGGTAIAKDGDARCPLRVPFWNRGMFATVTRSSSASPALTTTTKPTQSEQGDPRPVPVSGHRIPWLCFAGYGL
jgi:hypothetical protein